MHSDYTGVKALPHGKFRAMIQVNREWVNLGTYKTEYEAAGARDDYIIRHAIPNRELNLNDREAV